MNNFPTGNGIEFYVLEKVSDKELKDILKIAIDSDGVKFDTENLLIKPSEVYPFVAFDVSDQEVTKINDLYDSKTAIVTVESFKAFIKGKGKTSMVKMPFAEILELNSNYKATVYKNKVVVGCSEFTHEKIAELYALSQKAKKY